MKDRLKLSIVNLKKLATRDTRQQRFLIELEKAMNVNKPIFLDRNAEEWKNANVGTSIWEIAEDKLTYARNITHNNIVGRYRIDDNNSPTHYEIWFDIYQVVDDSDGDRLTYWEKAHVYDLDISGDYTGEDFDEDGIPIEWEDKYGYDPFTWEDHTTMDPDEDGLTNAEEWKTSQWLSDPFAQDIFIEVDTMEGKHRWSKPYTFPKESQYLLCNV